MATINIVNAKKKYDDLWALKGIDLILPSGEFFGLLGPNGAGKSTLINALVGLVRLSEGHIEIGPYNHTQQPQQAKKLIGFAPQEINLDRFFPIRKILMYQAGFYGVPGPQRKAIADKLLEEFGLTEKANLPYYKLSGGMQKRLLIAKALVGEPKILILDEPTAGVDVQQRHSLWAFLRKLNAQGTTILLTTHYIDEAEELCDRIGIIHKGEICELGSPQDLIKKYCSKSIQLTTQQPLEGHQLEKLPIKIEQKGNTIEAQGPQWGPLMSSLHDLIQSENPIVDLRVEQGTLEDVFLKVTGEHIK